MTPSRLARKRANDPEAQRAIRARTKAYIEHLEREIEEIKSKQSRDWTVQKLLRHNEALENELRRLRDNQRVIFMAPSPFSMTVCDERFGTGTGEILDLWALPDLCGYNSFPDDDQHVPLPSSHEQWASTIPYTLPSDVPTLHQSTKTDNYVSDGVQGKVLIGSGKTAALLVDSHTLVTLQKIAYPVPQNTLENRASKLAYHNPKYGVM